MSKDNSDWLFDINPWTRKMSSFNRDIFDETLSDCKSWPVGFHSSWCAKAFLKKFRELAEEEVGRGYGRDEARLKAYNQLVPSCQEQLRKVTPRVLIWLRRFQKDAILFNKKRTTSIIKRLLLLNRLYRERHEPEENNETKKRKVEEEEGRADTVRRRNVVPK